MLTDVKVRQLKAKQEKYKVADIDGLYLEVRPQGSKTWFYRYTTEDGKRRWKTLGKYPVFSLSDARARVLEYQRQDAGLVERPKEVHTFKDVALEFIPTYERGVSNDKEKINTVRRLELHVFPFIGDMDISEVGCKDVHAIAERLASRNTVETARKTVQICSRVFRYGMLREYCTSDPCYALRGVISKSKDAKHFAAVIAPDEIAKLLKAIDSYPQTPTRLAMQFSAYTFCRPGEVRHAEWGEFDMEKKMWIIPAEKMKARREHVVPITRQLEELLEQIHPFTGHCQYLFTNNRSPLGNKPMSENTVLAALRNMGYTKEQMTAHGFRSMASTVLNENGYNSDWIEMQLAHAPRDTVRSAYNRAKYWNERVEMCQWYADYLDGLRA